MLDSMIKLVVRLWKILFLFLQKKGGEIEEEEEVSRNSRASELQGLELLPLSMRPWKKMTTWEMLVVG